MRRQHHSVWVTQLDGGVQISEYVIKPVAVESDLDLLNRKAASHTTYGWTVVWLVPLTRFSATKLGGTLRERIFEIR